MPKPNADAQCDSYAHRPEGCIKRDCCQRCDMILFLRCTKFNVNVCLNKDRNYFKNLHTVWERMSIELELKLKHGIS